MTVQLVTDRTEADVIESKRLNRMRYDDMTSEEKARYLNDKGSYQYSDWNRVATACAELYDALTEAGYAVPNYGALPNNMTDSSRPTEAQLDRYIATVAAIKAALPTETPIPQTWKRLTIEGANNIERLLEEVDGLLATIQSIYLRSGVFTSGYQYYAMEASE